MKRAIVFRKTHASRAKSPWCCRWSEFVGGRQVSRAAHFRTKVLATAKAVEVDDLRARGEMVLSAAEQSAVRHGRQGVLDAFGYG